MGENKKGSDSPDAVGFSSWMFYFVIHDKHCVELPFIQMLTRSLVVCYSQWSTQRFLMIFVSLRSPNHVLTLRLLLAFASPPNSFVKFKGGNLSDGRRLD